MTSSAHAISAGNILSFPPPVMSDLPFRSKRTTIHEFWSIQWLDGTSMWWVVYHAIISNHQSAFTHKWSLKTQAAAVCHSNSVFWPN